MNNLERSFIASVSSVVLELSQFSNEVCDFIGCQFALFSDYGCSNLSQFNGNYCSFQNPLVRISCAMHAGDPQYHWAQYDDLYHCVIDYLLALQYHRPISTDYDSIPHFALFLRKTIYPNFNLDIVNSIYQQFKSSQS